MDTDELIDSVFKKRGYLFEWHVFLAEELPGFVEAYEGVYTTAKREGALPRKYRECVFSAVLAARGEDTLAKNHMHKALDEGATRAELTDALLTAWNPTGAITLCHGFKSLVEVLVERGEYEYRPVPYRVTDREAHRDRTFMERDPSGDDPSNAS